MGRQWVVNPSPHGDILDVVVPLPRPSPLRVDDLRRHLQVIVQSNEVVLVDISYGRYGFAGVEPLEYHQI